MNSDREKSITLQAFAKLGNEKLLHSYCEILHKLLGLVVDFISAENETLRLSSGSNFNAYCAAIRESPEGFSACHNCDVIHAFQGARRGEAVCYRCHAGLYEIVVPLFDGKKVYLGCLTSGQFHLRGEKKSSRGDVRELARLYRLDPEALFEAYRNSPTLSKDQLDGVISYLKVIGTHLTGLRENLIFLEKINTPIKIESIRRYLEENYTQKLLIRDEARKFYVSESFLSHNFKRELNVSFTDYINAFRVNKAKELLADTRLQVSEIAMMTGFGSISQFNRVFMAETGMSAKKYRQTVRQKNTNK
ncbi:MAG: PocR ligand-binding domain-containing protein [Lentisphaeria bacterium]|nr:PocR ligand-binding domain-containing protein [Lentisphaeria bacterium]